MFQLLNYLLPGSGGGYKVGDGKYEGVTNNHRPRPAIEPCHGQSCSFLDVRTCGDLHCSRSCRTGVARASNHSRERLCRSVTHVLSLNSEGFLQGLFVPKPTAFENELNASWRVRAQMWRVERTRQHTQPLTERFLARARRLFFAAWTPAFPTYHSL